MFKKKEKGPYPRSFAKRLTWRIMIRLFLVMGIISLIIFGIAWMTVYTQAYMLSNRMLAAKRMNVERVLSEVYVASVNTVPDIENTLNRPDRIAQVMKRIVELNPEVQSCGISFRENYYPEKGARFCPYAMRSADDSTIVLTNIGNGNDYLQAEWFTQAMKAKGGFWAKPFFGGPNKNTPLTAYLLPIRDEKDSTVAVLGVDVSLEKLAKENLSGAVFGPDHDGDTSWSADFQLYYFIIDPTGTFLMHPDYKRIGRENFYTYANATPDTLDNHLAWRMREDDSGFMQGKRDEDLVIEGEKVSVAYQRLAYTPWSMAMVVPQMFINIFGYALGGGMLFFILLGVLVVYFSGRRGIKKASQPLRQLAASADEVAKGNFKAQLPDIKSRDEIHLLRDSFENMQHSLTSYVRELRDATAQKAAIESEMKVAHDIQMAMLPKTFPPYPERTDIDIYGSLTPAKGVGGDLFDFYIRDEKLFFCIGDVSGKGVPASLFMAVTRSLFRNISGHVSAPEHIVAALNDALVDGNDSSMFVTVFVGVLDLGTGILSYCNAGHNAPLLVGRDVGTLSCCPNLPIGILADFKFTQQEVTIDPNTIIFLYTDGLNEAEDSEHNQFGDGRVWNEAKCLLGEEAHGPRNFVDQMTNAVRHFVGSAEQSDDLTMLAIQYKS